jgi:E1A/CREB-binding protein
MGGNNAYHWCAPCYNELKDNIPIELPDMKLFKRDLQKKKHDQEFPEPWVQCDKCQSWVHMICALFNNRRNISDVMAFVCPTCVLKERKLNAELKPIVSEKKMHASDLPHCKLSQFIETRVMERLEIAYAERARITDTPIDQVERCPNLAIRQVSSVDKVHRTREGMLARYAFKNYPAEFPVRSKCIVLFQNVDGQDLVLFGMYVYEYGHKCPQPNQRRVYISYLDSVHYFRPRYYRTIVYHEILVSYLEYVKMRGFHTAHIWACPPLKGDDYILYCHPQDQKTPKDDRLRQWYVQMLDICKKRGIVLDSSTDIFTEYLANTSNDASVLPYFEGDYWVGEAENIIKSLGKKGLEGLGAGDDEEVDSEGEGKASKSKSKSKAAASKKRDRSTRSGGTARTGRDVVMTKLAAIIEPMKEAFFVAKMHPDEYAKACMELRQSELNAENGDTESSKKRMRTDGGLERSASRTDLASSAESATASEAAADESAVKSEGSDVAVVKSEKLAGSGAADAASADPSPVEGGALVSSDAVKSESMDTTGEAKSSAPAAPKTIEAVAAELGIKSEMFNGIRIIDTEDVDDTMECEHFETRQAFLNICQGNHYQFDQLRRAKHTSLMVLYHLHNPDEPKFVAQCGVCNESILAGYRYHCEPCDVDYCQRCYQYNGPKIHPLHQLRAVAVGGQPTQLTSEQMRERQRTIQIHLAVLSHSALCTVADCKTKNCPKMKVCSA